MALAPATRLGPHEILAPLGAGGMGEVYRARDTRLDRTVAIKILPAQFCSDPVHKQRFEREAKTISHLNHPHICVLYDVGHQDDAPRRCDALYPVRQRFERPISTLGRGAIRPFQEALPAFLPRRTSSPSSRSRDLKPGNIMLTPVGAKLLDFGLAKPAPPMASLATLTVTKNDSPLTEEGAVVGTFQYMSPDPLFSLLLPENATGNYVKIVQRIPVKIVLEPGENRDRQLRPGMNVVPDVYLQ
jgi:serine/threonine protein kinase